MSPMGALDRLIDELARLAVDDYLQREASAHAASRGDERDCSKRDHLRTDRTAA